MKSQLLVRRRDIEQQPPPPGGQFRKMALARFGLPAALLRGYGVFCVDTTDKVVAITYDDGPHAEHTPRILDLLAARGATATFFVLGRQVEKHPEIARRIVADGHEIGLHGYDHRSLVTMEHRTSIAKLRGAKDQVESVLSTRINLYRPPYGEHTQKQARAIRRLGMDVVIWSGDAVDWAHDEEHRISGRALDAVFSGGILLMHDDRGDPETLKPGEPLPSFDRALVLERVLDGLDKAGYRTVQAGHLLRGHPHVRSLARERVTRA